MSASRLSAADKDEIVRLYLAGEKIAAIAHRFGVHFGYPGLLAKRRGHPVRVDWRKEKRA